jgi:hypothetical protein
LKLWLALDGTVKYHNVYKQEKQVEDFFKGVSIAATQVAGAASAITAFQGGEITMTYRDANGNMSSTIVREKTKVKWQLLLVLLQVTSAMNGNAKFNSRFQGYGKQEITRIYLLKLKQTKKYLLK